MTSDKKESRQLPHFIQARRRWFTLGIGVKRWLVVLGMGTGILGMGIVYGIIWSRRMGLIPSSQLYRALTLQWMPDWLAMVMPMMIGLLLIAIALNRLGRNLLEPFRDPDVSLADSLYEFKRRSRGPRIVAIGGGTGLSTLLRGLKSYTSNITAIVTVADDGGSSGRLREELGILPPGDFRNNITALARDEALLTQLLQYRFGGNQPQGENSMLRGHAFGNLLLAALVGLTGSFEEALLSAQRVLAIRGQVVPSTLEPAQLAADVEVDGRIRLVVGESAIPKAGGRIRQVRLEPESPRAYPAAIRAIFQADLIVIGPGSLYTSLLPNLLVPEIAEALSSAQATKIYVCNVATQAGETEQFTVTDHVAVLTKHVDDACFDIVLANDKLEFPLPTHVPVEYVPPTAPYRHELATADLVDEARPWRHDSDKLAAELISRLV